MVDRYAAGAFRCYCELRRLSPARARAELELLLVSGSPSAEADRWAKAGAPASADDSTVLAGRRRGHLRPKGPSWTT
jgi:hypothetical protein